MTNLENRDAAEECYYTAIDALAAGNVALAMEHFRAALACDATFTDAWHGLIRALQDAGHLEEALSAARQLAALEPEDVLAHTRLSILHQMQGNIPEAEAEAAKARILGWKQELESKRQRTADSGGNSK